MPFKVFVIAAVLIAAFTSSFGVHAASSLAPHATRPVEAIPVGLPSLQADVSQGRMALVSLRDGAELRVAQSSRAAAPNLPDTNPEPSQHALLLAGLACIGFIAARRAAGRR